VHSSPYWRGKRKIEDFSFFVREGSVWQKKGEGIPPIFYLGKEGGKKMMLLPSQSTAPTGGFLSFVDVSLKKRGLSL